MKNKTKILIIGSKGMLGQELVKTFKKDPDYVLTAWDQEDIDITKELKVRAKINELKPKIIINATGYNAVDRAEEKKEFALAKKLNSAVPGNLAKIAKKLDAILVNYSSDYVFDGQPEFPEPVGCGGSCGHCSLHQDFKPEIGFDESARVKPISNYGKSKVLGEKEVQKNGKKFYIVRLSKLFGKPASSEEAKRSFFDLMLDAGKKNKEVRVVDEETSCFTYAPDLAKKTKEIIESKKPWGIYHVTNTDPATWYEAVIELYKQVGLKTKVIPVSSAEFPRPAKRPYISTLINTRLNPLRSYKKALGEYVKT